MADQGILTSKEFTDLIISKTLNGEFEILTLISKLGNFATHEYDITRIVSNIYLKANFNNEGVYETVAFVFRELNIHAMFSYIYDHKRLAHIFFTHAKYGTILNTLQYTMEDVDEAQHVLPLCKMAFPYMVKRHYYHIVELCLKYARETDNLASIVPKGIYEIILNSDEFDHYMVLTFIKFDPNFSTDLLSFEQKKEMEDLLHPENSVFCQGLIVDGCEPGTTFEYMTY